MKKLEEMRKKFHSQKLKNEQGSITLFVIIAMLFFLTIGLIIFIANVNNSTSQQRDVRKIQSEYNRVSDSELDDIYNEQVKKQTGKLVITVIDRWKEIYETGTWTNSEDNKLPLTVIITWPEGIKESEKTIKLEGTINGKEINIEIKDGRITGTVPTGIDISNLIQSTDNGFVLNDGVTDCQLKVSATVNDQTTEVVIKVDRTNPTVELGPNGGNFWINPSIGEKTKTLESTITASDTNSGVKEIKYIWSESDTLPGDDSAWQTITNGTKVTSNPLEEGVYYLYVKVTDEAGNETIIKSSPFVVKEANYQIITGNNKDYAVTLAEAVNAANDGSTINVLQNYEDLSVTDTNNTAQGVLINKNVTIDTLGSTLTMENRITVASEKTVNFIDTATTKGKIERITGGLITNNGTVNIGTNATNGGNLESIGKVINGGTVKVKSGVVNNSETEIKSENTARAIRANNVTVSGGIVSCSTAHAMETSNSLIITGGEITSKEGIAPNGTTTISGGTISGTNNAIYFHNDMSPHINISGGQINGGVYGIIGQNMGSTGYIAEITITGGTITGGTNGINIEGENNTLTIGDSTTTLDTTTPIIQGATGYGIKITKQTSTLNFFDGKIIGKTTSNVRGIDVAFNAPEGSTVQFREGYQPYTSDIEINNETYHETVLKKAVAVTADANGGTIDTAEGWEKAEDNKTAAKTVLIDTPYGTLPTVNERPGYTFKGWNGKNQFDKSKYTKIEDYDISGVYRAARIYLKPNTTYKVSVKRYNGFNGKNNGYLLISNESSINNMKWSAIAHNSSPDTSTVGYQYTTGRDGLLYIGYTNCSQTNLDTIWANTDVQIEEGTTATEYEGYYITSDTKVVQDQDHALKAIWEANKYIVHFDKNDTHEKPAEGTMADLAMVYDEEKTLPANGFVRIGYKFNGWNTAADGTGTSFTDGQAVSNLVATANGQITLYAQWEEANYSVSVSENQTYYCFTLSEAVERADATGSTITVLKNCDDTSEAITLDKDITINTNGKTVTMTNGITVSSDKTLNISGNGTIKKTSGDLITNNGTVITENATLEAGENVINGGNVTVKSGTIKGGTNGILVTSENSTVIIGEANVTLDEVTPTIIGSTEYGVNITKSNSTLNFYNGVIKGKKTAENKGVSVAFVSDGTTTYREGYGAITTEDNGLNKTVLGTVQFGVDPQEIYLNLDNNRTGSITPTGNGYGTATYSSSDDTVARVSNTGTVEARKEGEATITITEANSGKTVTCKVVVDTTLPVWTVTVKEIR